MIALYASSWLSPHFFLHMFLMLSQDSYNYTLKLSKKERKYHTKCQIFSHMQIKPVYLLTPPILFYSIAFFRKKNIDV